MILTTVTSLASGVRQNADQIKPLPPVCQREQELDKMRERSVALLFLFLFLIDQRAGVWPLCEGLITL
ncbi:unnamed protein product [Boreogadus saida]